MELNKSANKSTSKEVSKPTNKLTCEQVYNLWATEPDLIRIMDVRLLIEFEKGHIPGAVHVRTENVANELSNLKGKLAIIIATAEVELAIKRSAPPGNTDYIFMSDCHRWFELQKPLVGGALNSILFSLKGAAMKQDIIFYQLFEAESSTYTYIIADRKTKEAAIIDPVLETVDRDLKLISELDLHLVYVLETHIHADHITGASEIRRLTKAKTAVSSAAGVSCADIQLEDGQELLLGDKKIKVIATPGHTDTCLSYYFAGMIFTGDALLIRGCGRTDFQQGSSDKLYESVHHKLFKLPDDTPLYPGHDYRGHLSSTVHLEKNFNPRIGAKISKPEFIKIMSELNLDHPKKIHEAVPANLVCGAIKQTGKLRSRLVNGVPEVTCEEVLQKLGQKLGQVRLIDVRRPDEFNGELGHIEGAELITLGAELQDFLQKTNPAEELVFICRSGGRSGGATAESIKMGFKHGVNMTGGMLRWNELKQPIERKQERK